MRHASLKSTTGASSSLINLATHTKEPLSLVHSEECGKIDVKLLSGANYFLTFINDKTDYVWVCVLKAKDEFLNTFWNERLKIHN